MNQNIKFEIKNQRLFAFGCSFTQYIWPTWADILGRQHKFFENWALRGAGNLCIFNSVIEANTRHKFTKNDTVMIMWSGGNRVDHYRDGAWFPKGPDNEFVDNDIDGHEIINYAYIDAIKKLLDASDVNYQMIMWSKLNQTGRVYDLYQTTIDSILTYPCSFDKKKIRIVPCNLQDPYYYNLFRTNYNRLKGVDWPPFELYIKQPTAVPDNLKFEIESFVQNFSKSLPDMSQSDITDQHPSPVQHLTALEKLYPTYTFEQSTLDWVYHYENLSMNSVIVPYQTQIPKKRL
jgi:hypothetical protein